jgi:hypothetical protein
MTARIEKNNEPLLTLKLAAEKLGLPVFKVTRAAKAGAFPSYTLFNSRRLVHLSEVIAAIESSRTGGSDEAK